MNMGEVKSAIHAGNDLLREARTTIEAAATEARNAARILQRAAHDTRDADVQKGFDQLDAAVHEVELAVRCVVAGIDHANDYLAALG
jgi:hypothetical protein